MIERWYRATFRLLLGLFVLVAIWTLATSAAPAAPAPAEPGDLQAGSPAAPTATLAPLTPLPPATATADPEASPASPSPEPTSTTARPHLPAGSPERQLPDLADPGPVLPPRLLLPGLDIDREVVDVPITDNVWNLESLGQQVGRLDTTGAHPGDVLAMTLVGHVTLSVSEKGPFHRLRQLVVGDEVVYRASGRDYVYQVVSKRSASPKDVDQLYVPDGNRLLLVTCSTWDFVSLEYARRLIVEAELIGYRQSP